MALSHPIQPVTADDEALRAALRDAEVPALLPALAQVTGDLSLLREEFRPDPAHLLVPQGGLTEDQLAQAREVAFEALVRFRDGGSRPAPVPGEDVLIQLMRWVMGGAMDAYLPLLAEELAVVDGDARAPVWTKDEVAPDAVMTVAVVGAGMSGLLASHRLAQAGIEHVVLEKNADVGGTWLDNTYPGCRVDVSNHLYSYSFAPKDDWPQHFSSQDVLLGYFREFAGTYGLGERIRFSTEVLSAEWVEDRAVWVLRLDTPDGEQTLEAQAVISGVGQLNRPAYPPLPGREDFAGPSFHSAQWDSSVDLAGKRVAVVGTGCSAAQLIPVVAEQARELLVFQRTPNWFAPTPDYHDEVAPGLQWLLRHVPYYRQWFRFWLFCTYAEGLVGAVTVDPDWDDEDRSVSAVNAELRAMLAEYLEVQLPDRPDLAAAVVPTYPPGSKRMIRDNGIWAATLQRPDVRLLPQAIERVTPTGIVTADGEEHEVDVVIWATGFHASQFLTPMRVTGRDGADLHEQWRGDARAYLGITVPNFPNFYCLYGPNTNIVVNGSIIFFSECEVTYVLGCLRLLLAGGHRTMDCRKDVHDAFNERVDAGNRTMAWGVSKVPSWYKNATGRVAQNWPFSLLEYWQLTQAPDPEDYELA